MIKEYWSNETWANWMIGNYVPENTWCLIETKGVPNKGEKVVAISGIGKNGNDLVIPNDKKKYVRMSWHYLNDKTTKSVLVWFENK